MTHTVNRRFNPLPPPHLLSVRSIIRNIARHAQSQAIEADEMEIDQVGVGVGEWGGGGDGDGGRDEGGVGWVGGMGQEYALVR